MVSSSKMSFDSNDQPFSERTCIAALITFSWKDFFVSCEDASAVRSIVVVLSPEAMPMLYEPLAFRLKLVLVDARSTTSASARIVAFISSVRLRRFVSVSFTERSRLMVRRLVTLRVSFGASVRVWTRSPAW